MGIGSNLSPRLSTTYVAFQTGFFLFGILLTGLRLWIRAGRFWWEDWLALVAACFSIVYFVTMWLIHLSIGSLGLSFWLTFVSYCMVVWLTRTSILCSVLRIATNARMRRVLHGSLMLFVVMWIVAITTKMWFCGKDTSWERKEPTLCPLPISMSIIEAVTDVTSALILVAAPIGMLWDLKLRRKPKIMLYSIFSMGFLSAATSILHIIFLVPSTALTNITALLQTSTDLVLCNLLVTATFVYHRTLHETTGTHADNTTSSYESTSPTPGRLTTVDLECLESLSNRDRSGATRGTDGEYSSAPDPQPESASSKRAADASVCDSNP